MVEYGHFSNCCITYLLERSDIIAFACLGDIRNTPEAEEAHMAQLADFGRTIYEVRDYFWKAFKNCTQCYDAYLDYVENRAELSDASFIAEVETARNPGVDVYISINVC